MSILTFDFIIERYTSWSNALQRHLFHIDLRCIYYICIKLCFACYGIPPDFAENETDCSPVYAVTSKNAHARMPKNSYWKHGVGVFDQNVLHSSMQQLFCWSLIIKCKASWSGAPCFGKKTVMEFALRPWKCLMPEFNWTVLENFQACWHLCCGVIQLNWMLSRKIFDAWCCG